MNFIIVENGTIVHLGPMEWNQRMFQNFCRDDLNVVVSLPTTNNEGVVVEIDANFKIMPAVYEYPETHNPKIEQLAGPFWTFTSTLATGSFTNMPVQLDAAKNKVKAEVAHNRWLNETAGITVNIQGQNVFVTTQRGERDIFLQALQQTDVNSTRLWKFNDIWLTLTYADLQQLVDAIVSHIQSVFTWEQTKVIEIDAATNLTQLDAIVLTV